MYPHILSLFSLSLSDSQEWHSKFQSDSCQQDRCCLLAFLCPMQTTSVYLYMFVHLDVQHLAQLPCCVSKGIALSVDAFYILMTKQFGLPQTAIRSI